MDAFQDPFGERLKYYSDQLSQKDLTAQQASDLQNQFNSEWTAYQKAGETFGSMGKDYKARVTASMDPKGAFMKTVTQVQQELGSAVSRLGAPADPTKDPTLTTPPTTDPVAAKQAAQQAATRAKQQATAGSGYAGTIFSNPNMRLTPILRKPGAMGY